MSRLAERLDRADQAVEQCLHDMRENAERPRGFDSKQRNHDIPMAMALVADRKGKSETPAAYRLSPDGSNATAQWVPKSKMKVMERAGDFMCCTIKGFVVIDRRFMQASSPQLSKDNEWTPEQRAQWAAVRKRLIGLREAIWKDNYERRHGRKYRTRQSLPFGYTA